MNSQNIVNIMVDQLLEKLPQQSEYVLHLTQGKPDSIPPEINALFQNKF